MWQSTSISPYKLKNEEVCLGFFKPCTHLPLCPHQMRGCLEGALGRGQVAAVDAGRTRGVVIERGTRIWPRTSPFGPKMHNLPPKVLTL